MAEECNIVIAHIAPDGSVCEICGKPAPWQMYCKDCGHIIRFYCDDHAYLSQGNKELENVVKRMENNTITKKVEIAIKKAKEKWTEYLII
jgi:hypothetical protein